MTTEKKTKIYIAASFKRRKECDDLTRRLPKKMQVISTWHHDDDEIDDRIRIGNLGSEVERRIVRDYDQIREADLIIIFIGDELSGGGRHTELGIALATKKDIALVGEYDRNPFERMPQVKRYKNVDEFLKDL